MKHRNPFPVLIATLAVVFGAAFAGAAMAGEGYRPFGEGPSVGEPLRFRAENGGAFRPRALIIQTGAGSLRAILPEASNNARSENRVDLSGTPVLGPLFRGTLSTDNARQGQRVGEVYRAPGDYLVLIADGAGRDLSSYPLTLTTNLPRIGAVSYPLGRLRYGASGAPVSRGMPVGEAWLIDGQLVLASRGGEPAYPSVEALFRDIFN